MPVSAGQSFGNFKVVRLVGEGGFGEVYEVENPLLQRRAAVKVLHKGMGSDPELVRRFLNEARAASAIRHPGIIEVFDAGVTADGEPYILMEYLEGDSLQKKLLRDGRMDVRTAQEVVRQAGGALSSAHAMGIVHRDLKPENIFLTPDPLSPFGFRVKVLDFGIAKIKHRDESGTVRTQAGLLMGSPTYMSPEQCRDSADVDHRSDIYALGIILYEMLAGVPPFTSKSSTEMLVLQITADPAPLSAHRSDLPSHIEDAVMRSLAKDREQRFESVDYFVGAVHGTYPAKTAPVGGSGPARPTAMQAGMGSDVPPSSSRVLPNNHPAFSTMTRATGEILASGDGDESPAGAGSSKRWLVAVAALVVLGGAGGVFYRIGKSNPRFGAATSDAPATIHVRVSSLPAGASVREQDSGKVLGTTPVSLSFAKSPDPLWLVLSLPGFKDKRFALDRVENFATQIDLEPSPSETKPEESQPTEAKPSVARAKPEPVVRKKGAKAAKKQPSDSEDEWRLH